uniref:Ig-like domain-containing protein n=1 Tax=Maylandia zebra TaxID=106582 RepID=A0A3P9DBG9_9CICH
TRTETPPKPAVFLQSSWTQIYSGDTVTLRCEIQGGEGAQWTYEWRQNNLDHPPTSSEYRISSATKSDSGGYSCRGKRGSSWTKWSDITKLTVSCKLDIFHPFLFILHKVSSKTQQNTLSFNLSHINFCKTELHVFGLQEEAFRPTQTHTGEHTHSALKELLLSSS